MTPNFNVYLSELSPKSTLSSHVWSYFIQFAVPPANYVVVHLAAAFRAAYYIEGESAFDVGA